MLNFTFGVTESGHPMALIGATEQMDALKLMRALHQAFPDAWAQVNLEMIVAKQQPQANGVNRILGVDGKPNANP